MELGKQIAELETIIQRNISLYSEMESALEEELAALESDSLASLDTAIKRKMDVVARLKLIEDSRVKMVYSIAEKSGVSPEEITLSRLAEKAGSLKDKILGLKDMLRDKVKSVTDKNDYNRGFIEKLMRINHSMAANLQELITPESTYGRKLIVASAPLKPGKVVSRTF